MHGLTYHIGFASARWSSSLLYHHQMHHCHWHRHHGWHLKMLFGLHVCVCVNVNIPPPTPPPPHPPWPWRTSRTTQEAGNYQAPGGALCYYYYYYCYYYYYYGDDDDYYYLLPPTTSTLVSCVPTYFANFTEALCGWVELMLRPDSGRFLCWRSIERAGPIGMIALA